MDIQNIIAAIRHNRIRITDHADEEAQTDHLSFEENMKPFDRCPICNGKLVEKEVEKLLKGGVHTAVLTVRAEVCLRCGERLYASDTVKRFEQIRHKLELQQVGEFQPLGQSFTVEQEVLDAIDEATTL